MFDAELQCLHGLVRYCDNYVLQAMALQSDIIMKKLQNQEIVEFHDCLRIQWQCQLA